jgi:5-methylcytosine-specific restriction enzyme A
MPNAAKPFFQKLPLPTANQRGYDKKWNVLRDAYLQAHPFCEDCLDHESKQVAARIVDHKRPFSGLNDPLRLDWGNLRSLCDHCHVIKTCKDKNRGLTTLWKQQIPRCII